MNLERDVKNIAQFAMRVAQVAMLTAHWSIMGSDQTCTGDRGIDRSHNVGYCESDGQISDHQLKNSQMARVIREGSTVIINASTKHSATVILSHGLGDSADGWTDAAEEMARQLPHIKWILPTAPTSPVTLNGGMRMPSWYDIESLSRSRSQQECKGIDDSTDNLHRIISAENGRGIQSSRIVLAGFSQGGAMSLWTGLQFPSSFQSRLAGVLVLSGYLPKEHAFTLSEHGKETPVLHCHGTIDAVVLPEFAEESRAKILGAGHAAGYELRTYRGMAHSANMQEIMDVIHWLGGIVPDIKT